MTADETVEAMAEARGRMERAMTYGQAGGLFDPGTELMDYLEVVRGCPLARPDLERAREGLLRRLERGAVAADGPGVDGLFLTLLRRYEAICDALDLPACRVRLTMRLGRLQAVTPGGEGAR